MPNSWPPTAAMSPLEAGLIAKFEQVAIGQFNELRHAKEGHGYLQCGVLIDSLCRSLSQKMTLYGLELRQARAAAAAAAPAAPIVLPTCKFTKLSMIARRTDRDRSRDAADTNSGRHWALMIKLAGYYTIVDLTHLQYDLPIAISHGTPGSIMTLRREDVVRYSRAIFGDEPFVFCTTNKLEARGAWEQFIRAKPFVERAEFEQSYTEHHRAYIE